MPKFEFIDGDNDDYFDVLVEVVFEKTLEAAEIMQVIKYMLDLVQKAVDLTFTDGLAALKIEEQTLEIRLRYSKAVPTHPKVAPLFGKDDLGRLRMNFIFYLIAKIDTQFSLKETPFPPDFRYFLNFPDSLREYYDIDF